MWKASIIFILVYTALVLTKHYRWLIAWIGIAAALLFGALEVTEIARGINWNVIGIFVGSLLLAEAFVCSRLPETISDHIINRSPNLGVSLMLIIVFASIFSIFMDNVVTVLMVAPIALEVTKKADVSPVPVIIGIAISSNLQGMAILIGDTPSMILAARAHMDFLDFFFYNSSMSSYMTVKIGIFWLVQLGALAGFVVLYYYFRGEKRKVESIAVTSVKSWVPVILLALAIVMLSLANFIDPDFVWFSGVSCVLTGGMSFLYVRIRKLHREINASLKFDWETVLFLSAVFVLVYMLEKRGVVAALVNQLDILESASPFVVLTAIVWVSVLVSAFIDNVPYITAALPVVQGLAKTLGVHPELLVLGVLIGSCMGGNITPIGAAANLTAIGILRREGRPVSFAAFVKIGLPFTLAATLAAYIALYFVYR
ncbi:MAG: SLC13 family permease [Candidatus Krumholzibacteriota bacterium]|nr:SLC13 family permease [Candidatus Krumholzibacteriota bacterium]